MSERASVRPAPPDLLHPEPSTRLDEVRLSEAMVFGFATGDLDEVVEDVMARAELADSTFDPADFAEDVFLPSFVERCLSVTIDGHAFPLHRRHLTRLLGHPPADPEVTRFRQAVLQELTSHGERRRDAERLYRALVRFRDLLTKRPIGGSYDANRRRIDILRAIQDIAELASSRFVEVGPAFRRVGEWGRAIVERESYRRLCELVAYERNIAEVDVRIVVGLDGSIRGFQPLSRRENLSNRFYQSPIGRFFMRIFLYLRGYRFSETEVLSRLVDDLFSGLEDLLVQSFQLLGDLEFYLSALGFRDRAGREGLAVSLPTFDRERRSLVDLFNPLLFGGESGCVPCTLSSESPTTITIVTGPNSGGKTRLMQAIALTQALAQAGMFVPARGARLPWASGLFVSVIEHARVDQCEGRLGMELLRIRRLFENAHYGSLIVLDELCSGTNPTEGEEIFQLVLELLEELRPQAFITTHFLQFAQALKRQGRGLEFLQVELDAGERPTYAFVPGVATTSLAHQVAARLGVTREELRAVIRRNNPELSQPKGPRPLKKVSAA